MSATTTTTERLRLTEEQVADAFHSYLKSSLAQAKAERLLDTELLSSAEADIMIAGPALCLYFAALRCTTTPPSVPLPRTSKMAIPHDLSYENCPPAFASFLQIWTRNVTPIQQLIPEHQHDLARIICGLPPIAQPINPSLNRVAAELRAVAIEISQRRTFQDRYAADLQAAIDAGEGSAGGGDGAGGADQDTSGGRSGNRRRVMASFVPPPMYEPSPVPSPNRSPASTVSSLPTTEPLSPSRQYRDSKHLPLPPTPTSSTGGPGSSSSWSRSRTPSPAPPSPSTSTSSPRGSSFMVDAPAMQLIRETLYASLGEVFASHPFLRRLLLRDPPRAYFASVALAILDVSVTRTSIDPVVAESSTGGGLGPPSPARHHHVRTLSSSSEYSEMAESSLALSNMHEEPSVTGILGAKLTLRQTPPELRPFMRELCDIGRLVREMEDEDSQHAVEILQDGGSELPEPTMDRVRRMLERGIAAEGVRSRNGEEDDSDVGMLSNDSDNRSIEGRAITLANRINGLSLSMTKLRAFKERQSEVFKVLASVRS